MASITRTTFFVGAVLSSIAAFASNSHAQAAPRAVTKRARPEATTTQHDASPRAGGPMGYALLLDLRRASLSMPRAPLPDRGLAASLVRTTTSAPPTLDAIATEAATRIWRLRHRGAGVATLMPALTPLAGNIGPFGLGGVIVGVSATHF